MANSIALATKYEPILDELYSYESRSAILDTANSNINWIGADTVKVAKMSLNGLADYSRNSGFVAGSETLTWETMQLTHDRGISYTIDRMDSDESLGQAFGRLAGEFIKVHEVPEVDAVRFAKYASAVTPVKADITVGTTDVPGLIDAGTQAMDEAEVPYEGRILFVSPTAYAGLKAKITRYLANETEVQRNIEMYNDMRVITVPQSRFNTLVTLNNGGGGSFGFAPTAGGYKINFMIIHPSAVVQPIKHRLVNIIPADLNQTADGDKFNFRVYYDAFTLDNKIGGIYCHCKSTANS